MKRIKYLTIILFCASIGYHTQAQTKDYPDSLKSVVIKIEPLSLLFGHISGGIEVPLGKTFLDFNIGVSDVGVKFNNDATGGVVAKGGIKLPFNFSSPFSIFYVMPEFAISNYRIENFYDPMNNTVKEADVKAKAILLSLGYRHINPTSRFYYDAGFDFGYGWCNIGVSNYQYNFLILGDYYSQPNSTFAGLALSCHLAAGIILNKGKAK